MTGRALAEEAVVLCGATAVFWPDDEGCEATCIRPLGHEPRTIHEDEILGEWDEDDLPTSHPGAS